MKGESYKSGQVLLLDKPLHWTSFQVVNKIRWAIKKSFHIKKIKVGHAGTLDPLATGLLIVCTGKFTKKIKDYQGLEKEYTGIITLGATTPSYDLETAINEHFPIEHIDPELLEKTRLQFLGDIKQTPPVFSAIKQDGKRLYESARKGEKVTIKSRIVNIREFEITDYKKPNIHFRIVCSKGTYIRAIANDFGKALHSGGHLTQLRRTKIGNFSVENAVEPLIFINNLERIQDN